MIVSTMCVCKRATPGLFLFQCVCVWGGGGLKCPKWHRNTRCLVPPLISFDHWLFTSTRVEETSACMYLKCMMFRPDYMPQVLIIPKLLWEVRMFMCGDDYCPRSLFSITDTFSVENRFFQPQFGVFLSIKWRDTYMGMHSKICSP